MLQTLAYVQIAANWMDASLSNLEPLLANAGLVRDDDEELELAGGHRDGLHGADSGETRRSYSESRKGSRRDSEARCHWGKRFGSRRSEVGFISLRSQELGR